MTIQELHSQLVAKKTQPVYMFTGEEIGIMNIYISQISKLSGMQIYRADSFEEVYGSIKKQSSTVCKNFVYVIRDDKDIQENEKAQKIVGEHKWKDIVIFLFTSLDKRTKFYKQYKDTLTEFNYLNEANLKPYIKRELKTLSDNECIDFAKVCECDYSRILLEVDKVRQYAKAQNISESKSLFNLLKEGTIYQPPKDAIFEWCDAIMNCSKKAFDLYNQSLLVGEATLPLITVLYNNIKQTLQVQSCTSKDISKSTGLTGWQIQCGKKYVGKYTDEELKSYLQLIRECEVGIKTGTIEESMVVPYIMFTILGGY